MVAVMRPHLSTATDVALSSAAAAVVAMGMGGEPGGGSEEEEGELGAVPAARRVLRLKSGASRGQVKCKLLRQVRGV